MSTDAIEEPQTIAEKSQEIPVTRLHECSDGKTRNDEQYEQYKKQEEAAELKKAQFNKDPDMFVHIDDIVVAAIRSATGIGVMVGRGPRPELEVALTRITFRSFSIFQQMEVQQIMKSKGLIETPPESGKIIV